MTQDKRIPWFNFSPSYAPLFAPDTTTVTDTIIGSNIEQGDGQVERRVLQEVGSYGYQLNRIIDVLSILLDHATANGGLPANLKKAKVDDDYEPLTENDAVRAIENFYTLAGKAAKASETYKSQAMDLATKRLMKRMKRLRDSDNPSDNALYVSMKAQIETELIE